jgi:hypothetical protein
MADAVRQRDKSAAEIETRRHMDKLIDSVKRFKNIR